MASTCVMAAFGEDVELRRELEEAKLTIVQLRQQLAATELLLQQERAAREQAEVAAMQAAQAAELAARAAVEASQHSSNPISDRERSSMELMLQRERAARKDAERAARKAAEAAEVAARAAVEASRHRPAPAPVALGESGSGNHYTRIDSGDFEMEDVSDPHPNMHAVAADPSQAPKKSSQRCTKAPSVSASSKVRETSKKASAPTKDNKQKLSLAEVRRAAQEETERHRHQASMIASRSKRDVRHTAEVAGRVQMNPVDEEEQLTIAEMKEIIQRERKIRQQAQLAAEQALTAAKEAQKAILQLEHELDSKGQQLEQERMAREQAELHVAAQKAINASRTANTLNKSSPVKAEKGECVETMPKREVHELKTEDPMHSPREVTATVEDKSSLVKRPRDSSETQSPAASKKPRDPNKNRVRACQGKASKHKMSLKEARKAAQDEIEKRMEQRAKQLSSRNTFAVFKQVHDKKNKIPACVFLVTVAILKIVLRHAVNLRVAVLLGNAVVDVDRAQTGRAAPLLAGRGALLRVLASKAREDEREQDRQREDDERTDAPHDTRAEVLVHVAAHQRGACRAHALLHSGQQTDHRSFGSLGRRLENVRFERKPHPRVVRVRVDDHADAVRHDAEDDAVRRAEALKDLVGEEEERQLRDGLSGDDDAHQPRVVARQVEIVCRSSTRTDRNDGERLEIVSLRSLLVRLVCGDEAQQDEERDDREAQHHVEAPGDADGGGHDTSEIAADTVSDRTVQSLLAVDTADVDQHGHGRLIQQRPRGLRLEVGHEKHDAHDVEGGHEPQREHEDRGRYEAEDVHQLLVLEHVGHSAPDGRRNDGAHTRQRQQDADLHLVEVLRVVKVDLAAAAAITVGLRGEGAVVDGEEELERHEPLALAAIDGELDEAQEGGHLGGWLTDGWVRAPRTPSLLSALTGMIRAVALAAGVAVSRDSGRVSLAAGRPRIPRADTETTNAIATTTAADRSRITLVDALADMDAAGDTKGSVGQRGNTQDPYRHDDDSSQDCSDGGSEHRSDWHSDGSSDRDLDSGEASGRVVGANDAERKAAANGTLARSDN
ncbi:hypothetical protein ON010_g8052 [Phytophthora cinnamomi]|nr:hypothetical protein ON010_g8052 [Phytophthora cinnamomi]